MKITKLLPLLLSTTLLLATPIYADELKVNLNDEPIAFTTPAPQIINNRTMLPLRGLFDKMGFKIEWDSETKTATLTGTRYVLYAKDGSLAVMDRSTLIRREVTADVAPQLVDGYFMLPVRAIAEATDTDVDWNSQTRTVSIYTADYSSVNDTVINVTGSMKTEEDEYLKKTFELVTSLKDISKKNHDGPMQRFFGTGYVNDSVVMATVGDHSDLEEVLTALTELEPPDNMKEIDLEVEKYVALVKKAYMVVEQAQINSTPPAELTKTIDELKKEREQIAIQHGIVLYNYFTKNAVMYEQVYGDYILDILK